MRSGRSTARTRTFAISKIRGASRPTRSSNRRRYTGHTRRERTKWRERRRSRPAQPSPRRDAHSSSATIRRSMGFAENANALIQERKFDDLESLWMNQIDTDPSDIDAFLRIAKALRKSEQRTQSDTLLGLLGDTLLERKMWAERLHVLKEIGRLSKHPATLRQPIEQALRNTYGSRKSFQRAFDFAGFAEPASNPVDRAEKIETWLQYDEGETFFMAGRGAGVVVELNPELGIARLDFETDKRGSVPLGAAAKFLTPITKGH